MEAGLSFGVLGPLEVRQDGEIIEIPRRKERQLVAALLLDANTAVSTDLLIERLWSEDVPAKPLTSLRACVSNVRKALAGDGYEQPLVTDRGGYLLTVDPAALDSLAFESLVSTARQKRAEGDAIEAAALLDQAMQLVRGEPLADMAYDEFTQREVGRLAELVASAEELQAQVAIELGQAAAWLPRIGELIAVHPLREQLQATRMIALYQLGRQADALRCYSEHRRAMIDELGIEPSPELQALESRILSQDQTLLITAEQSASAAPEPEQSETSQSETDKLETKTAEPSPSVDQASQLDEATRGPKIVGREAELAVLNELAARPPGHAFIIGESGLGKSTVANSFLDQLAASGWRTARALCPDDDGVPPLWPWRQIFRDLDLGDAAAGAGDQDLSRFEFLDDLATSLTEAAAHSPIAVLVDDLQWADQDTLKLITHLDRLVRNERLLIIGAARTTPTALSGLAARWIELKSFTVDDVAVLIEELTGETGDIDLAADLHQRTGGNAYFVTELIEFARRFGDEVGGDLKIPSHVRELVEQRIALLPEPTQELLETAALELQNFSLETLAAALGQTTDQVREQLKPAIDIGVVTTDSASFERFRFDHAIARETMADRSDPAARIRRHAALGAAIEELAGPDAELHATQLSRHYGLGAPAGTAEKAVHWAEVAAAKAAEAWSHRDATVHLQRALEADKHLTEPNPERRCQILIRLALYAKVAGDVATTDAMLAEALRLAEQVGEPNLLADVAIAMSEGVGQPHWRWYWSPVSTAVSNMQRVLESMEPGDSATKVALMNQLASDGYVELTADERLALLTEAAEMAERIDEPALHTKVLYSQRTVGGWTWPLDELEPYDRMLQARYEEQGEEIHSLQIRGMVMADLLTRGDFGAARQAYREMNDLARLRGSLAWRYFAHSWQVFFAQMEGQWELAAQLAAEALDPVTGLGEDFSNSVGNQSLITSYYRGDFEPIATTLQFGIGMSDRPLMSRSLLNVLAVSGQIAEAETLLETIDPARPDIDSVGGRIPIALAAEALVAMDRPDALPPVVDLLRPAASTLCLGNPGLGGLVFYGPIRHHLASGLVALDQFEEAAHHIELGREHMTALKAKPHLLRFDFVEATLVHRRDGKTAARTLFEEVQAAASDAGMFGLVGQAERLLAD